MSLHRVPYPSTVLTPQRKAQAAVAVGERGCILPAVHRAEQFGFHVDDGGEVAETVS